MTAGIAEAQDASGVTAPTKSTDAAATTEKAGGLEDIVVTAQRREQRLQTVPVVVSAFTDQTIERLQLTDTITTSKFVPGMISNHNVGLASANAYFLRGLGNSLSTATFDAPVTTYVDDVYIARQNANNYAFFDTQRVEVLRGPQGTLFGRNTTGGAVNVILRKPSDTFGYSVEATGGSYDRYTVKGTVDIPLSTTLLSKFSAYVVSDDGYLKNITTGDRLNGEDNFGGRADFRFIPNDKLTIDLSAEYMENTSTYAGLRNVPGSNPYLVAPSTTTPKFYETAAGLPKTDCSSGNNVNLLLNTGKGNCNLSETAALNANAKYETSFGTLNYIFGYRHLDQGYIVQYDGTNTNKYTGYIIADNGVNEQVSHDLKLNGDLANDRVHYVAGIFYLKETTDDRQTTFFGGSTTAFTPITDAHLLPEAKTAAIYTQEDVDLTKQFTLTLGARYTWEQKNVAYLASNQFAGLGYTSAQVASFGIPLELTQWRVTPRVALSYKVTPDIMVFASATNGFKSGGWNGTAATPSSAVAFKPERTWSYEGGVKSEWLDHALRFNVTGFIADTEDLQATAAVVSPVTKTIVSLPFNAGTLNMSGIEVESNWAITPELSVFANPSWMNGHYSDIVPTTTAITTQTQPTRIPAFQFSGGVSYLHPVEALGGSVGGVVTYRHNDKYFVALLNTTKAPNENYLDAAIKYQTRDEHLTLSLEGTNLTDQETVTTNFLSLFGGDPRRYTIKLRIAY